MFTHIVIESDPSVDVCDTPPLRGIDGGPPLSPPDQDQQDATSCADDDLSGWSAITRLFVEDIIPGDMNQLRAALRRFARELEVRPVDRDGTGSAEPTDDPGTLDTDVGLPLDAYLDVEGSPQVLTDNAPHVPLRQLIDEAIAEVQREHLGEPRVLEPQPKTGARDNADAPPKTAPPTPNERRIAQLEELLDAAKKTGNADALVEAFSKKFGLLTDGQYSTFRTQVKKAMGASELYIDMRAMDRVRADAKKRIDRQTALMKKVDDAFKAGRSTIIVSNRQLADLRVDAVGRLRNTNDPPVLFQRQRELVRYRSDAMGNPYLETLTDISLRGRLTDVADFLAESGKDGYVATIPPRALCEDLLAYPHAPGTFPVIEAITQTPLVRSDGTVFATPGYDPATRMIYAPPPGFTLPPDSRQTHRRGDRDGQSAAARHAGGFPIRGECRPDQLHRVRDDAVGPAAG